MNHVSSVKRIIRYLKGTSNFGICFRKNYGSDRIRLYSDSDFAGDLQDRNSTSGGLILMNGGPVIWYSKEQTCIARSTAEAEYIALSVLISTANFFKNFLESLPDEEKIKPWVIREDNQSCIAIANQASSSSK